MGREVPQQQQQQQVALAVNPYNPDILPDLENYVNEQVSSQTYSLDTNLCLLRLYQFEPDRMSTQIVARILVKVCTDGNALSSPDFSLCLFLIPERVQMEEQFKTLIVLSQYLETGRFSQFWDEASKNRHIVEAVPEWRLVSEDDAGDTSNLRRLSYEGLCAPLRVVQKSARRKFWLLFV
ncbi:hypothetical protein C1H46_020673 [Malus baccata]|uniref:CSN8/PSMD8/EIF3K domain-containing protein n=1 Tax=Malus baccata TaxID=106549 RepID=A0A540M571_MALBA|nr:hypothetical protein C1H46_020673 [Malus baccata]